MNFNNMKNLRKNLSFLMVVAILLVGAFSMSSCKKVDYVELTDLRADNATPTTVSEGYNFSYNTYGNATEIMTNGNKGDVTPIKAPLTMKQHHAVIDVSVNDLNSIGNISMTTEYRKIKEGSGNGLVYIDSALVVKLSCSAFTKEILYPYQGAKYKAEKVSGNLKNHRFVNPTLGSWQSNDVSAEQKQYTNTVTLTVNGQTTTTNITLNIKGGGDVPGDEIVSTRMVNSGTEVTDEDNNYVIYDAWMELEHTLANGQTTQEKVWARNLVGGLEGEKTDDGHVLSSVNFGTPNIITNNISEESIAQSSENIVATKLNKRFDVTFENGLFMDIFHWDSKAVYTGKVVTLDFPVLTHQNLQHNPSAQSMGTVNIDGVDHTVYVLYYTLRTDFGTTTLEHITHSNLAVPQ